MLYIPIPAGLIIRLYEHSNNFDDALARPSRYFISVSEMVANILTHYFQRYFHSNLTITKGKVTHHNATMQAMLIQ